MVDVAANRPFSPPRQDKLRRPSIPADGTIPVGSMPDSLIYDEGKNRLLIGDGFIENVSLKVWEYEVSGKQIVKQWFSYRKADRSRPIIGDRRPPSPLGNIQPDHWLAEYTTELLNLLNVLGRLVELEATQAKLLDEVCAGDTFSVETLKSAGALENPTVNNSTPVRSEPLFGDLPSQP